VYRVLGGKEVVVYRVLGGKGIRRS
jgi:hypothetical protein